MRDVLVNEYGLDLTGWKLTWATDVSADGTVIVGYGQNPSHDTEAWVAIIPEPSTFIVWSLLGALPFLAYVWRRRRWR